MVSQPHNDEHSERSYVQREELFPIRTVSSLTGVNSVTLRAWERRYRLIRPKRTDSGHRLYDQEDIDRIRHAVSLVDKGMSISQASRLIHQKELQAGSLNQAQWQSYYKECLVAVDGLDEVTLAATFGELFAAHPVQSIAVHLLFPLLEALEQRAGAEDTGAAFFRSFLRNKLGARFHHRSRTNTGPLLLCSMMPGDYNEIELLIFALAAAEENHRILMLGSFTSLSILTRTAEQSGADAIVLFAGSQAVFNATSVTKLSLLAQTGRPVFVGGRGIEDNAGELADSDCTILPRSLEQALKTLGGVFDK